MKVIRLLFVLLIAGSIVSCKKSEVIYNPVTAPQIQDSLQSMIDKLMKDYKEKYPTSPDGIALKVISKKGAFFVSSGLGDGITDQVHFRAASNTKSFTATAILLLAQRGMLHIDNKISDTIPGTSTTYVPLTEAYQIPFRDQITIRQLLQHKAGVFDLINNAVPDTVSVSVPYKGQYYIDYLKAIDPLHTFTFDELVGVVATCRLFDFPPGEKYSYSNIGYDILGKIIERVSGQSYQQFVMENIVKPMGLSQTTFPYLGTDVQLPPPFVRGYEYDPGEITDATESNLSGNVAEGNIITTPYDLSKFLRNLVRGEGVLKQVTVNSIMLPFPPAFYGCGIYYSLNLGFGHNGSQLGFLSRMVTDPEVDFTAVAFLNCRNRSDGITSFNYQLSYILEEACYRAKLIVQ